MSAGADATYPPLNTLKRIAADVWMVDGPLIRFGPPLLRMPFPTRMTIIRRDGGGLFVHSPTPLVPELRAELAEIGAPRWIVAPNRLHYWWVPQWREAYPDADIYLAPRIREQAGGRIGLEGRSLDGADGYPWDRDIATQPIRGSFMTEVEFFHRPSRTLVLTDLIENFEPAKQSSWIVRWLVRLGGVSDPYGKTPLDLRLTFRRDRPALRQAVETMISWQPERIVLAHGRWYERDGTAELRRAFRWLLQ